MRISVIVCFISFWSFLVEYKQKIDGKFSASYNTYWQWVKKMCFVTILIPITSENAYIPLFVCNPLTVRRIFLSFMVEYNTEHNMIQNSRKQQGGELYG